MKIVTANIPDSYIRLIEEISSRICASKSELLRIAIKQFLLKEMGLAQKLEKELNKLRVIKFFDYCINCEKKIDRGGHKFHKNFEVFELKFCCSCYKKFKDKSFEEFPTYLIHKIKKKIKAYKSYKEKSDKIEA